MTCKGICIRYQVSSRYVNGHRRCQHYNIFIKYEVLRCPCCGYQLRIGPRHFRYSAKLREQKQLGYEY